MRAILIEILAADPGRDDVDRPDVAQRALGLIECLARRVVSRGFRAAHQLDDLHDSHLSPPSASTTVPLALTPSSNAARCHGPTASASASGTAAVSTRNRSIAAAIAAASSSLGVRAMPEA